MLSPVKNLNGAAQNECSSGSWLAHCEKFSGQTAYSCFEPEQPSSQPHLCKVTDEPERRGPWGKVFWSLP